MQSNNIFADMAEKFSIIKQKTAKGPEHQIYNAVLKEYRTAAVVWMIAGALLLIASIITSILHYKYYRFTFDPSYPEYAGLMAIAICIIIEVGKVWLGYQVTSSVVFSYAFRNYTVFLGYFFAGLLAFGIFKWSYNTSTEGIQLYAAEQSTTNLSQGKLSDAIKAGTADIDKQIAALETSNQQASSIRTKSGKNIAWDGRVILAKNAETLPTLLAQKDSISAAITADYNKQDGRTTKKVDALTGWIVRFGGYMEYATFLCLLVMTFFDKNKVAHLTNGELAQKVIRKMTKEGIKLTPDQLKREMERAATMNGSYESSPFEHLGK